MKTIKDFKRNNEVIVKKTKQKTFIQDVVINDNAVFCEDGEVYNTNELELTGEVKQLIYKRSIK